MGLEVGLMTKMPDQGHEDDIRLGERTSWHKVANSKVDLDSRTLDSVAISILKRPVPTGTPSVVGIENSSVS